MDATHHVARVLRLELGGGSARIVPHVVGPAPWGPLERFGGSALAVALVGAEHARDSAARPLVIACGDAVRRGVPTAARAVVAGIAPLHGRYTEGQIGGDLGARVAAIADGIVLVAAPRRTRVASETGSYALVLHAQDRVELELFPELAGASPERRIALCLERFGASAVLCTGPAGDAQSALASLASGEPPSFVGRGGLGAVLGGLGLAAIVVTAEAPEPEPIDAELVRRLAHSPRLVQRADGGGFEQAHGFAVRGDLGSGRAVPSTPAVAAENALAWASQWRERRDARVGCRGCPTPCGFVFEGVIGGVAGVRGHFGAVHALGASLEPDDREGALRLLAACDHLGVDAKEVGVLLELVARACESGALAEPSPRGRLEQLVAWIERLVRGGDAVAEAARYGAEAFAEVFGLETSVSKGLAQPIAPRHDLAALAIVASAGAGTDPMRSFPFATEVGRERLLDLLADAPLGTERPELPAGKGLVAWWHENLVAALDTTGFCVFSGTALLADGLLELGELAQLVAPPSIRELDPDPARALLAVGASVALARAELAARLGAVSIAPEWAAAAAARRGVADLYRACRGLDAASRPTRAALAAIGAARAADPIDAFPAGDGFDAEPSPPSDAVLAERVAGRSGVVLVAAGGPLGRVLGGVLALPCDEPITVRDVLARVVAERPEAERFVQSPGAGRSAASVWCDGRRLEPDDRVRPGDRIDLVLALSGG